MLSNEVVDLFCKNFVKAHGVVNVGNVIKQLADKGTDSAKAFEELLKDDSLGEWHFCALEGMRSLAVRGSISPKQARLLLEATAGFAKHLGWDEYYNTLRAIALSPNRETAEVVLEFAEKRLTNKDLRDWRWLAFFAVGTFLQRPKNSIPQRLADQLKTEAGKEPDPTRRQQLEGIAQEAGKRVPWP